MRGGVKVVDREDNKGNDRRFMQMFAWWAVKRGGMARCAMEPYCVALSRIVEAAKSRHVSQWRPSRQTGSRLGRSRADLSVGSIRRGTRGKRPRRVGFLRGELQQSPL